MRRERLLLTDMIEAADAIGRFVSDSDEGTFCGDELVRSAVLHQLTVVGEAASHLPRAFRSAHPHVPWADIVAFRNFVVHSYFAVDWKVVWATATLDVPELRRQVAAILALPSKDAAE